MPATRVLGPPKRHGGAAVLCAFDLIELDGEDLRRSSIEYRKRKLGKLLRAPHLGIVLNEHYEGDGNIIFKHACKLGCEGIVSKRLSSRYRPGRSKDWVKVKNPNMMRMPLFIKNQIVFIGMYRDKIKNPSY
jgi:ATP-dependent DNA ligase